MCFKRGGMALEAKRAEIQESLDVINYKLDTYEQKCGTITMEMVNQWKKKKKSEMGHDHVMLSLASAHYTNKGIKESRKLSVAIADEVMLPKADYVGCISASKEDKSDAFVYHMSEAGVPIIDKAPVVMECTVEDIYNTQGFESFICTIDHVYAEEAVVNEQNKIDYRVLKPVLFEMPTYEYLRTGDVIGACMKTRK